MDSVSQRVKDKLRSNALSSKIRVKAMAEKDKECSMRDEMHVSKYGDFTSLTKYLSGFLTSGTLDISSAHAFAVKEREPYRMAEKKEYIFVDQTVDKAALDLDSKWLESQDKYVMKLKKEQLFDLYGYSFDGDRFVNNYLRGTFNVEHFIQYLQTFDSTSSRYFALFFPALRVLQRFGTMPEMVRLIFHKTPTDTDIEEVHDILISETNVIKYKKLIALAPKLSFERFWTSVLEDYVEALEDIIRNAPPCKDTMVIYRGVDSDYFLTDFMKNHTDRIHIAKSFVSTSSSVSIANQFVNYDKKCCFIRLYIPAGTRMVMMIGVSRFQESEFLLGHKSQFYITKARMEKFCKRKHFGGREDAFEMRTTSVVVI